MFRNLSNVLSHIYASKSKLTAKNDFFYIENQSEDRSETDTLQSTISRRLY